MALSPMIYGVTDLSYGIPAPTASAEPRAGLPPRPGTAAEVARSTGPETVIEIHLQAVAKNVARISRARLAYEQYSLGRRGAEELETPSLLTDDTLVAIVSHRARVKCLLAKYRKAQVERDSLAKVATVIESYADDLNMAMRAKPSVRGPLVVKLLEGIEAGIDKAND